VKEGLATEQKSLTPTVAHVQISVPMTYYAGVIAVILPSHCGAFDQTFFILFFHIFFFFIFFIAVVVIIYSWFKQNCINSS